MHISQTLKTPEGTVKFQGELTQEEADYVIQTGLLYLLQNGLLPFKAMHNDDLSAFQMVSDDPQ